MLASNRIFAGAAALAMLAVIIFLVAFSTKPASAACSSDKRYKTIVQGSLYAYHEIVPVQDPYCGTSTPRTVRYYYQARELYYTPIYEIYTQYARAWLCGSLFYYGGPLDQNSVSAQYFNSSTTSANQCGLQADLYNYWDNGSYGVWDYINF